MPAGRYSSRIDLERQMITFSDESDKQRMFLMGTTAGEGGETSWLLFKHLGNVYAPDELKSDAINWVFQTTVPVLAMESGNTSSQVEVALNR